MKLSTSLGGTEANILWGEDWPLVRALWRLDRSVAHLNHGSFGAVPVPVLEEQQRWRNRADANPNRFHERELPRLLDGVRERVAGFVGADPAGLVLLPNATAGMASVLASAALEPDDELLVTDQAYPGVRAAACVACAGARGHMRVAALGIDILHDVSQVLAALNAGITPRTRLVIVDHITSPTAAVLDVRTLVADLHARGLAVAIDGAHAPGSLDLEVAAIGADYYIGNLHKWCCAPRGAGFIAIAPARRADFRPAVVGSRWEDGFPNAMEWWGTADYSALLSAPKAFDLMEKLGRRRVREHGSRLAEWGQRMVADALGTAVPALPHAAMTLVPLPAGIACTHDKARYLQAEVAERLRAEVMLVAHANRGYLRLSAHAYNRPAEYELLARRLPAMLREVRAGES
jgi:isopenicillin-N epimerase